MPKKRKLYRCCNCDYEPNIDLDNYVINYLKTSKLMTRKRIKGLRKISIKKDIVLDFHYHLNGQTHDTGYYVMYLSYYYKGDLRGRQFKFKL
jgi:hypothetical protein|tara:strand:+ start:8846 stop:9121 length:276 start_codon:yes stop_codon:yes gene_type:complete